MIKQKKSVAYIIGTSVNYLFLCMFGLVTLLPFLNLVAEAFSGEAAVVSGIVRFWPVDFQIDTVKYVFMQNQFLVSFKNSTLLTIFGTFVSLVVTALTAYPLSRKHLRGRKVFLYLWMFVMMFNGGLIPNYMLYRSLNLLDTFSVLLLPFIVNVFNMLIIKNYFEEIPDALEEAARIDGASNLKILFKIMLPVSAPTLATIALFYAVTYWNDYFTAMMYISSPGLKPLQQYLYELVYNSMQVLNEGVNAQSSVSVESAMNLAPGSVRATTIVVSTMPILCVYPFLQKYFVKGIVIGSVKG